MIFFPIPIIIELWNGEKWIHFSYIFFFLHPVPQFTVFFFSGGKIRKWDVRVGQIQWKKTTPQRDGVHTPNARLNAEPYIRYTYPYNLYLVRIQRRSITFRYDKSVGQIGAAVFLSARRCGMALFYRKKQPSTHMILLTHPHCSDGKKESIPTAQFVT